MLARVSVWQIFILICVFSVAGRDIAKKKVEELIIKWAPLVWLAPEEKYLPSGVEEFLKNVFIVGVDGNLLSNSLHVDFPLIPNSKSQFLVTKIDLESLKQNSTSFIHGRNPNIKPVPSYAISYSCIPYRGKDKGTEENFYFHVTYWLFYPYNEGKSVCFIGNVPSPFIFGRCFGHLKTFGNHVGDWEHMSLSFRGSPYPDEMYLATHESGVYYKYDADKKIFKYIAQTPPKGLVQTLKFPPIVRMSGGHPVLFAAQGSHGLWSAPGEHYYFRVPKLSDKNGYGIPWKTWNSLDILHLGDSELPDWINFKGKWGNPKNNCLWFKKLGICELSDGPTGILMKRQDFYC